MYVRMLFTDYSSAFSTIVPATLVTKLRDPDPQHRPSGLCAQPSPVLPVHT